MKFYEADLKPLVMIVDDMPGSIQVVGNILNRHLNCELIFSTNSARAFSLLERLQEKMLPPDLILLDVVMPEVNGMELCAQLKNDQRTCDIPVVFLTAKDDNEDIIEGFKRGAVDYIPKPFQTTELIARVRNQLTIQRQNSFRKEMLHVLCHDLLAPFGSMVSCLELIDEYNMFVRLKNDLSNIANSGIEIIDLARQLRALEDRGLGSEGCLNPLHQLVEKSYLTLEEMFENKKVKFINDIPDDMMVKVERGMFSNYVLNNLLSNAVKFSMPGQEVIMTAERIGSRIIIECTDSGIGMPAPLCKDLFDIRKATSRQGTNGEHGNGLGLPVTARIIHEHGGTIAVASEVGKGTTFRITLKDAATLDNAPQGELPSVFTELRKLKENSKVTDLQILRARLNLELNGEFSELEEIPHSGHMMQFCFRLGTLALKHKHIELAKYVITLHKALRDFNVEFIPVILEKFREIVNYVNQQEQL